MLLLMRSQNIPYEEISRHVGKPETQLKVYYQRLKERLMKKLGDKLQYVTKN
jgi:DNA-directed RNA polymerase specialized sigma24 family protein